MAILRTTLAIMLILSVAATEQRVTLEGDIPQAAIGSTTHWKRGSRCTHTDTVNLMVMLTNANEDTLLDTFHAVSDPRNARYGDHLTQDQVTDLVAPPARNLAAVINWLQTEAPTKLDVGAHADSVEVELACPAAERLLDTELFHFKHTEKTHAPMIRAGARHYSVPASVAPFVRLARRRVSAEHFFTPIGS